MRLPTPAPFLRRWRMLGLATLPLLLTAVLAAALTGGNPAGAQDDGNLPAKPPGLRIATEPGSLDVSLDWGDVDRAGRYWVRWRSVEEGGKLNQGVQGPSSAATITVAGQGQWVVRVQACNGAGCGQPLARQFTVGLAPEPTPEAAPAPPTDLAVSSPEDGLGLSATWAATDNATSYRLRWRLFDRDFPTRDEDEEDFLAEDSVTVTAASANFTVRELGQWEVRLQSCNDDGCSPSIARTVAITPGRPGVLAVSATPGELDVSLDWDDVEGADTYLVRWRSVDNKEKLNVGVRVESSEAAVTMADYGDWVARVEACNDAGCGGPRARKFTVEPPPEPTPTPEPTPEPEDSVPEGPANLEVSAAAGELDITATWDALEGATSYKLSWRRAGGAFEAANVATVSDSSAAITVSSYGRWEVRVQGCNDAGCGPEASRTVHATAPLTTAFRLSPARLTDAKAPPELITASWDPVPSATSYNLLWRRSGAGPSAGDRRVASRDSSGASESGQRPNPQQWNNLKVPGDRNSADFNVGRDGEYDVKLEVYSRQEFITLYSQNVEVRVMSRLNTVISTIRNPGHLGCQARTIDGLQVVFTDGGIEVSWDDPGISAITRYQVRVEGNGSLSLSERGNGWSDIPNSNAETTRTR